MPEENRFDDLPEEEKQRVVQRIREDTGNQEKGRVYGVFEVITKEPLEIGLIGTLTAKDVKTAKRKFRNTDPAFGSYLFIAEGNVSTETIGEDKL